METLIPVLVLWMVGCLAAQHLVAWLHSALSHGLLSLAAGWLRGDRDA